MSAVAWNAVLALCYDSRVTPSKTSSTEVATERLDVSQAEGTIITLKKVRLVVVEGPDQGKDLLFDHSPVRIGTLVDSDFCLTDRAVSKRHAAIERSQDGYVLRDLGSTNGTYINDMRAQEVFLTPGAMIRVGQTKVKFHPRDEDMVVLPSSEDTFHGVVGTSVAMRQAMGILQKVATAEVSVVIYGETGTGKELAASALHDASPRAKKSLVVFDCGNVDKDLIRSELFGHEVGAFTGATTQRVGAFESANGGTLFLDEVGELPLDLQPKLLRVLEQRTIQRLGATAPRKIDVRIVCATHRNLEEMVQEGKFREDLFYRLCQIPITLPPLRDRTEDIPKLVETFLTMQQKKVPRRERVSMSPEALDLLGKQDWRGNVRELRNVVERSLALSSGTVIQPTDLLMPGSEAIVSSVSAADAGGGPALANRSLEDVEKEAILQTLAANGGNRKKTARILGIAPVTLREKLKKYGVPSAVASAEED